MSKAGRLNVKCREGVCATFTKMYALTGDEYWQGLVDGIRRMTIADVRSVCSERGLHIDAAMRGRAVFMSTPAKSTTAYVMQ